MSPTERTLTETEKRQALSRLLASPVFQRSDQLRSFLSYVVEREIDGHGEGLNEYSIGVDALGRPGSYSPSEDAVVRNRAFSLRKKLEDYYSTEGQDETVQIHLPKGSYRPIFRVLDPPPATPPPVSRPWSPSARLYQGAIVLLIAWVVALSWRTMPPADADRVEPELRRVWGPVLAPADRTLICVASPAMLAARPNPLRVFGSSPNMDGDVLLDWYRSLTSVPSAEHLYIRSASHAPFWGEALAATSISHVISRAGGRWEILPERVVSLPSFRRRNVVLIGKPEHSVAARRILEGMPLTLVFDESIQDIAAVLRSDKKEVIKRFVPTFDKGQPLVVYGLVTVTPSEGAPEQGERTILFSGTHPAAAQAAADYFQDPNQLRSLLAVFRKEGLPSPPPTYQVLLKSDALGSMGSQAEYVMHAFGKLPR